MIKIELRVAEANQVDYDLFDKMDSAMRYSEDDDVEMERKKQFQSYEEYDRYLADLGTIIFINLEGADEPIGFFRVTGFKDNSLKINDMYITKANQGKGYGKKAVKQLIEDLKDDFERFFLMSYSIATDCFWSSCSFRVNEGGYSEFKIK